MTNFKKRLRQEQAAINDSDLEQGKCTVASIYRYQYQYKTYVASVCQDYLLL